MVDYEVCAVRTRNQLVHPKTAIYKVKRPFLLVFVDLIGPIMREVRRGYKYASNILDEYTIWTEMFLLESKNDALNANQPFIESVVIPVGFCNERLRTIKRGKFTCYKFRAYCL